ncbi:dihydrodiol dehydrogenase [Streptomyces sp. ME18-1-4]|uniref:dihydrodiol dehydrogenase n=1 Tax=Streptomyces sp. ME18-1-4 TaxID=3028685 RepID=UPI0029AF9A85|nr:dihydrodiol dehydrogenase [Streptomyces sp. ME18-1-4]MDX3240455.1 dihydrodiol dehydrogenase [Streptomyces sp. ME18-1-4]
MDEISKQPTIERPPVGDVSQYPEQSAEGPIVIANEFADVVIRKVETRNGMRLDIWSPRRGSRVLLDAVALDCLTFQEPELISELLERRPAP